MVLWLWLRARRRSQKSAAALIHFDNKAHRQDLKFIKIFCCAISEQEVRQM